MEISQSIPPRRVFLLSHARTGCHLLERMLSAQPNTSYGSHYFAPARPLQIPLLEQGPLVTTSVDLQQQLAQAFQSGFTNLEAFLDDAHKDDTRAFFHGHPHFMLSPVLASQFIYKDTIIEDEAKWTVHSPSLDSVLPAPRTNPTILPDAFFRSFPIVAIFTIRHPLLMVPSIYRAIAKADGHVPSIENLRFSCTLRWSRILYEWIIAQGLDAVIVDAKEYMSAQTIRPLMAKLCKATGLEVDAVIYEWPKATEEEMARLPPVVVGIIRDILVSEGLRADKDAGDVVAEVEEVKWKEEFGEEVAVVLKDLVDNAMGDYLYMREKAIKVDV